MKEVQLYENQVILVILKISVREKGHDKRDTLSDIFQ